MALGAVLLALASPLLAPQLLAFPHKAQTPVGTVWSDERLPPEILSQAAAHTLARLSTSPLASHDEKRWIFITDGGWRWQYIANFSSGAFAITRPFSRAIIVNRTDPQTGVVHNGQALGAERELGDILAHEFTHGLITKRYGILASTQFPKWKVEGYCDYVAGKSTLSAQDAARLKANGEDHPALVYFEGRRRVEAILKANGGSVDDLFEGKPKD